MTFNSLDFAIFLPIVFGLYWLLRNFDIKYQNLLILAASYVFYAWWDYKFLSLIVFSTLLDFFICKSLDKNENKKSRKILLWTSIVVNLGLLGFFKYFNFFITSFNDAFSFFGSPISIRSLAIVLPVGISFYTFQTLSYTIDVYKRNLQPSKNFIAFASFVSFFPQLVAGPIERASNLLPQFNSKRYFDYQKAVDGLRQILWGLFKKVVVADNCATIVNQVFENQAGYAGSTLLLAAILFAFQIYCDFSGYSDIAIGTARLFGFSLMQNFAFPYFSRDIAEFWRRWHISLSTWFRDYLYIPLGGSKGNQWSKIRNTFIIFVVSGFWHGANWTFVAWGLINALLFLPLILLKSNRKNVDTIAAGKWFPNLREILQLLATFGVTTCAWVFFRAKNISAAFDYLKGIFSKSLFSIPSIRPSNLLVFIVLLILMEWFAREKQHALENIGHQLSLPFRYVLYFGLSFLVLFHLKFHQASEFIYFQF